MASIPPIVFKHEEQTNLIFNLGASAGVLLESWGETLGGICDEASGETHHGGGAIEESSGLCGTAHGDVWGVSAWKKDFQGVFTKCSRTPHKKNELKLPTLD